MLLLRSYRGTSSSVVLRFTDVFVPGDGRWRAVASHGSLVAEIPAKSGETELRFVTEVS
jgi:hypothetical protein